MNELLLKKRKVRARMFLQKNILAFEAQQRR